MLTLLGDPLLQIVTFVFGTAVLVRLARRNRARKQQAEEQRRAIGAGTFSGIRSGFRDLKWGEPPRPDMTVYHDGADEKLFVRRRDALVYAGAPLKAVLYAYKRNQLQAVMLEMPHASADDVRRALVNQWGRPLRPNPAVVKDFWPEILSGVDAMQAVLEDSPMNHYATLVISSKVVAQHGRSARKVPAAALSGQKAEREQRLSQASSRFGVAGLPAGKAQQESDLETTVSLRPRRLSAV
jgi:hypothetical protein